MIENRIKHRHLTCFVEVAREKSIGRAAFALAISQPAVSKTIRELEEILGVELFDRSHRSVVLSPFGEVFLRYANASISALRQGVESVDLAARSVRPALALAISPLLASRRLAAAVGRFTAANAGVALRIVTTGEETHAAMVRSGDVDFAVVGLTRPAALEGLSFEHLYEERLVALVRVGHPLADEPEAGGGRLPACAWLTPPVGSVFHEAAARMLVRLGAGAAPARVEVEAASLAHQIALSSDAVWIAPRGECGETAPSGLTAIAHDGADAAVAVGLLRRADRDPSLAAAGMMAALRAVAAEEPR